jgi:hypothetical protein
VSASGKARIFTEKTEMNASELLAEVKIAMPCRARWSDMAGNERSRFCAECNKQVYNLSVMTAEAAAALIREKEGKLCARFYRRRDGTKLTTNCPVGTQRLATRMKFWAGAVAGLLLVTFGAAMSNKEGEDNTSEGPFVEKYEEMTWWVKGWLGMNPPMLGKISVVGRPQTNGKMSAVTTTGATGTDK